MCHRCRCSSAVLPPSGTQSRGRAGGCLPGGFRPRLLSRAFAQRRSGLVRGMAMHPVLSAMQPHLPTAALRTLAGWLVALESSR